MYSNPTISNAVFLVLWMEIVKRRQVERKKKYVNEFTPRPLPQSIKEGLFQVLSGEIGCWMIYLPEWQVDLPLGPLASNTFTEHCVGLGNAVSFYEHFTTGVTIGALLL